MRPSSLARACALAALWTSLALRAPAAPNPPARAAGPAPSASTPDALIDQGIAQRKAGDDRAALDSFRRAYELDASPRALAQQALAEQALGRWLDAYEHLARALSREHPWIREHRGELEAALDDISTELGSLEVTCNVDGAEIYVDGRSLGKTPSAGAFRIVAGQSVIQVVAPGYFSLTRQVRVEAGGLSRVDVRLTPRASDAEGERAAASTGAQAGAASLDVTSQGGPEPWRDALMYGALGAAGLGVATGVTGYVVREVNVEIYNDDERCDRDPELRRSQECREAARAWRLGENLAIGGFVAAGVFGALGLYLWLDRPARADGEVACSLGPGTLMCAGAF